MGGLSMSGEDWQRGIQNRNENRAGPESIKLVLQDGTTMEGYGFGAIKAVSGEVVFNTNMAGYVETLTDPSYVGKS